MKEFIDNFEVDQNKLTSNVILKRKAKKQLDETQELVNFIIFRNKFFKGWTGC